LVLFILTDVLEFDTLGAERKYKEGAHRALAFPDFVGLSVGMGLEQYRKGKPCRKRGKRKP
jgi:hypothetical protein